MGGLEFPGRPLKGGAMVYVLICLSEELHVYVLYFSHSGGMQQYRIVFPYLQGLYGIYCLSEE